MKKTFVVFVCILTMVTFLSSAWAIDRDPKNKSSDRKKEPTEFKQIKKKKNRKVLHRTGTFSEKIIRRSETTEKITPKKSEKTKGWSDRKKSKERYDYFIDRNNNGIDDRLEKDVEKKKLKEPKVTKKKTPAPSEKVPVKISPSNKAPKKVKDEKVGDRKKEAKVKKTEEKREGKRR